MNRILDNDLGNEAGFTLVELLVVILIIGILTAIAIPMFLNQRKEAIYASIKADLRSAIVDSASQLGPGANIQNLTNYVKMSPGNSITITPYPDGSQDFCLIGSNTALNEAEWFYYDSRNAGLKQGIKCSNL